MRMPRALNRLSLKGGFLCISLGLLAFCASGCKDRTEEVAGNWDWGNYTIHMDPDQTWDAVDKRNTGFEKMGGSWSISGDDVSLSYSGGGDPNGFGSEFTLSPDGHQLAASSAAVGAMVKE